VPILPRYFFRLFAPSFLLTLLIFVGVLVMNQFIRLFNMALMKGLSPLWIFACFARLMPYFMSLAVPMAFLVGLLLTLGQLSERGEIMALRASGFSFMEIAWPFLSIAVLLSGGLLLVNHKASPDGFHSFKRRYIQVAQQMGAVDIQPASLVKLGPWRLFSKEVDADSGNLSEVYLTKAGADRPFRVEAPRGRVLVEKGRGVVLELEDGSLHFPDADPENFTNASFKKYRLNVPIAEAEVKERERDIPEINSRGLRERAADPKTEPARRTEYLVEFALRSAGALSPFVFFWIGMPLGLGLSKRGRGFAMSLIILFAFYGLLALGIGLGRRLPDYALWMPWIADVAGLIAGAYFTARAITR
jgi:lipopolysaccharide export LptBFGC system permease protein LptF